MTGLYERLTDVGRVILGAVSVGLQLSPEEVEAMMKLDSDRHSQLRLLHYPAISKEKAVNEMFTRLPAHTDWGAFTMLFQDGTGGLELMDPESKEYLGALPEEGVLVLNVGDMLQRFTNGKDPISPVCLKNL
jgi:isopenicillin N synthase-like dioxygenase